MNHEAATSKVNMLHVITCEVPIILELNKVKQALSLCLLKPLPEAPNYHAGLLNLAGTSIPVIDLGMYLKLPRKKLYSLSTSILICEHNSQDQMLGLLVDEVIGLVFIDSNKLQPIEDASKTKAISAVTPINSQLALLLNFDFMYQQILHPFNTEFAFNNAELVGR